MRLKSRKTGNTYTSSKTYTPSNTNTYTSSNTFTNTVTNTFTDTPIDTVTNTFTNTFTDTPTFTITETLNPSSDTPELTPTETFTKTYTETFTETFTGTNTKIATATNINVATHTPTITNTRITNIDIVTPETELPMPELEKDPLNRRIIHIKLPRIEHGSFDENKETANADVKYLIHVRKLKRNGVKDKNYKLGFRKLSFHKKNKVSFNNMDKGIYSVRYQIHITRKGRTRHTNWSPRNHIEI